jgi:bifunctional UDP-N-acetylglucosamine pyrophosphorylase/glucosamine-1-phosphate N-acetyltransferase
MTQSSPPLAIIILAAGKGTRMNSDLPKVLHRLDGQPLIQHVLQSARQLNPTQIVLVIGHQADLVRQTVGSGVLYAEQTAQLGTAHAVAQAEPLLRDYQGNILILYGDMPLLTLSTLRKLIDLQASHPGPLTMLTVIAEEPRGFGRIVRDDQGAVIAIVEEADCTPEQLAIKELNVGVYCIQAEWLWSNLTKIEVSPKGEYYLTDLVAIAVQEGHPIKAVTTTDLVETLGINTETHLAEAEAALKLRGSSSY